ncbi:hypothetical protein NDU88_007682 [Pleurodeles waltl]|uniref:Uncharacterized protein n=1 Tax=Pleurodeles waltl TaxID=8319 RepID=A0AAV7N6K9_PLEWA|nr:hypothetical protein NDU88_007682 [Pleurodeles waltl]
MRSLMPVQRCARSSEDYMSHGACVSCTEARQPCPPGGMLSGQVKTTVASYVNAGPWSQGLVITSALFTASHPFPKLRARVQKSQ